MTSTDQQLLATALKSHGYSLTNARMHVFKLLLNQPPQTIQELYIRAHDHMDRVSLYRTLKVFEQIGITQRVSMGWKYKIELSDSFSHHHHHISCTNCGCIIATIEDQIIEERIHSLGQKHKVKITAHQLEIQGICQKCQKNR